MATKVLDSYWDSTPKNENSPPNMYILNSKISKLRGCTEEVIFISGVRTWTEIKSTIITNFGDRLEENSLLSDSIGLRQKLNEYCVLYYNYNIKYDR